MGKFTISAYELQWICLLSVALIILSSRGQGLTRKSYSGYYLSVGSLVWLVEAQRHTSRGLLWSQLLFLFPQVWALSLNNFQAAWNYRERGKGSTQAVIFIRQLKSRASPQEGLHLVRNIRLLLKAWRTLGLCGQVGFGKNLISTGLLDAHVWFTSTDIKEPNQGTRTSLPYSP